MKRVRVGIVGVGNCAACLVQGVEYYRSHEPVGLISEEICGYGPDSIEFSCAFDVNAKKVGLDLSEAIWEDPNNPPRLVESVPNLGVTVAAGPRLDGIGDVAAERIGTTPAIADVVGHLVDNLQQAGTDVLVNFLPVGAQEASEAYAAAALQAGVGFVNAIPTVIARDKTWATRFAERALPIVGDDVKSQVGATITHRVLVDIFSKRGVELDKTYQLNVGGNMDFFNMQQDNRLGQKKVSKRQSIDTVANRGRGLEPENLHVGPSDYVPFLGDTKIAFIRLEGRGFAGNPTEFEARFQALDSPNSAGVVFDAIRYAAAAKERHIGGVLNAPSAWLMKAPPIEEVLDDADALRAAREWESEAASIPITR